MNKLLIATTNRGKVEEFRLLFRHLPVECMSLADIDSIAEPVEDGTTFEANAKIKAAYYAKAAKLYAIADDSGLEVFSLGNRPGVFSARFAGPKASDTDNNSKLLTLLEGVSGDERGAQFRCAIALSDKEGRILTTVSGSCPGRIEVKPFGSNGFGYDPVFVPEGYEETFGDLSKEVKSRLSHRALAAQKMVDFLSENSGLLT